MHNSVDAALRDRAQRVIPNGMWGHMNVARIPAAYPQYFARAEGCHLWDVDGREYVDFMCAYGPMLLGYNDADVNRAADEQRAQGDIFNGPSARLVELAELMVETVAHADWAMFQKNGSDATTTCAMIAREATGKRKILVANGAYHGAVPWCNPYPNGATAEDRVHLIRYDFNDVASLERAAAEAGDDLAGVFVSAFKHDLGKTHEAPTREFAQAARRICDKSRRCPHRRRRARRLPPAHGRQLGAGGREAGPRRLVQGDRQRLCARRRHRQRQVPRRAPDASSSPARSGAARSRWPPGWRPSTR